jgi:hypothetical protein
MTENENNTVAAAGKEGKKKPLTKADIKGMSKYQAQQILNEKDPEILNKIEAEVAAKAAVMKKKIMIIGFVIMVIAVGAIVYMELKKNS